MPNEQIVHSNTECCTELDRIKKLEDKVEEHEEKLSENKAQFAVITTKLNMIMGILASIGAGLVGIILNFLFK